MSQPLSPILEAMQKPITTLASCQIIARTDGKKLGFTNHDSRLNITGTNYYPNDAFFDISAIEQNLQLKTDNYELQGVIAHERINKDELLNGRYDNAKLDIFMVDYTNLPQDQLIHRENAFFLSSGIISKITLYGEIFSAEILSIKERLNTIDTPIYSPLCRAKYLGSKECKVNLTAHTYTTNIVSFIDHQIITIDYGSIDSYTQNFFTFGFVNIEAFQTKLPITADDGLGKLKLLTPYYGTELLSGNSIKIIRGCDKQFSTCRDTFTNHQNFRGEPRHLISGL